MRVCTWDLTNKLVFSFSFQLDKRQGQLQNWRNNEVFSVVLSNYKLGSADQNLANLSKMNEKKQTKKGKTIIQWLHQCSCQDARAKLSPDGDRKRQEPCWPFFGQSHSQIIHVLNWQLLSQQVILLSSAGKTITTLCYWPMVYSLLQFQRMVD